MQLLLSSLNIFASENSLLIFVKVFVNFLENQKIIVRKDYYFRSNEGEGFHESKTSNYFVRYDNHTYGCSVNYKSISSEELIASDLNDIDLAQIDINQPTVFTSDKNLIKSIKNYLLALCVLCFL